MNQPPEFIEPSDSSSSAYVGIPGSRGSQPPPEPLVKPHKGFAAGLWTMLLVGLGKFKFLLGFLKFGKVLATGGTMLLSILAYALVAPLPFAIGFVLLIFLHEMGHALVLMRFGIRASAPLFIPFVGAMIGMKEMPKDVKTEALVAYGGPLAGALAAYGCFQIFQTTGQELFVRLAHVGFFLNLFNLIPLTPLDGGRITAAISKWFWIAGFGLLLAWFLFISHHPLLFIILILGGFKAFGALFKKQTAEEKAYYQVGLGFRFAIAGAYFLLVFLLAEMSLYTDAVIQTNFPR